MGIRINEIELLEKIPEYKTKPQDIIMAELGNQRLILDDYRGPAKPYFEKLGIKHFSFDLNGLDGSISLDLSKPIEDRWVDFFDIITNSGTTEHITNKQSEVFKNIHDMCKTEGYMVHSVPLKGCWKKHSPHKYNIDFFKNLALINNYEIIFLDTNFRWEKEYNVRCVLKKINKKSFKVSDSWLKELETTNNYKKNTDNLR